MHRTLCFITLASTFACAHAPSQRADATRSGPDPQTVREGRCEMAQDVGGPCVLWGPSLIELIARPELYNGKRVRVIGFVNFEFEGNGLYVSREDWRHSIYRNGVWIDPPARVEGDSLPPLETLNQRYVLVEATFRAGAGGHFGMWSGSLANVTRLERWSVEPPVAEPPPARP